MFGQYYILAEENPFILITLFHPDDVATKLPVSSQLTVQIVGGESPEQTSKPQLQNGNQNDGETPVLNLKGNNVFELSISGTPGSKGWLRISTKHKESYHNLVLFVAFRLSPCLWGFQGKRLFNGFEVEKVCSKRQRVPS